MYAWCLLRAITPTCPMGWRAQDQACGLGSVFQAHPSRENRHSRRAACVEALVQVLEVYGLVGHEPPPCVWVVTVVEKIVGHGQRLSPAPDVRKAPG